MACLGYSSLEGISEKDLVLVLSDQEAVHLLAPWIRASLVLHVCECATISKCEDHYAWCKFVHKLFLSGFPVRPNVLEGRRPESGTGSM